eukprot:1829726-Rhodomonas_salina.1
MAEPRSVGAGVFNAVGVSAGPVRAEVLVLEHGGVAPEVPLRVRQHLPAARAVHAEVGAGADGVREHAAQLPLPAVQGGAAQPARKHPPARPPHAHPPRPPLPPRHRPLPRRQRAGPPRSVRDADHPRGALHPGPHPRRQPCLHLRRRHRRPAHPDPARQVDVPPPHRPAQDRLVCAPDAGAGGVVGGVGVLAVVAAGGGGAGGGQGARAQGGQLPQGEPAGGRPAPHHRAALHRHPLRLAPGAPRQGGQRGAGVDQGGRGGGSGRGRGAVAPGQVCDPQAPLPPRAPRPPRGAL